jgi:hypothetical protein
MKLSIIAMLIQIKRRTALVEAGAITSFTVVAGLIEHGEIRKSCQTAAQPSNLGV